MRFNCSAKISQLSQDNSESIISFPDQFTDFRRPGGVYASTIMFILLFGLVDKVKETVGVISSADPQVKALHDRLTTALFCITIKKILSFLFWKDMNSLSFLSCFWCINPPVNFRVAILAKNNKDNTIIFDQTKVLRVPRGWDM